MVSRAGFQDFRIMVGYIFVLENGSPGGLGMTLNLFEQQTFSPTDGLEIHGNSSASEVYFAAITPGAVLEEGVVPVVDGQFTYKFDPKKMASKIKTYDIVNLVKGKPEIGRIVQLTFFSEEKGPNGPYHSFVRVILRGTTETYVKTDDRQEGWLGTETMTPAKEVLSKQTAQMNADLAKRFRKLRE